MRGHRRFIDVQHIIKFVAEALNNPLEVVIRLESAGGRYQPVSVVVHCPRSGPRAACYAVKLNSSCKQESRYTEIVFLDGLEYSTHCRYPPVRGPRRDMPGFMNTLSATVSYWQP
jgi:hypothetical protein